MSRLNQYQGQIKVIFEERYSYAGGLYLNQMRSCLIFIVDKNVQAGFGDTVAVVINN